MTAFLLLGLTVSYAQESVAHYRVKITKESDGKVTETDTLFSASEKESMDRWLEEQKKSGHESISIRIEKNGGSDVIKAENEGKDGGKRKVEKVIIEKFSEQGDDIRFKMDLLKKEMAELKDIIREESGAFKFEIDAEIEEELNGLEDEMRVLFSNDSVLSKSKSMKKCIVISADSDEARDVMKEIESMETDGDGKGKMVIIYKTEEDEEPVIVRKEVNKDKNRDNPGENEENKSIHKEIKIESSLSSDSKTLDEKFRFSVSPNPGSGKFDVSFYSDKKQDFIFSITDSKGAVIKSEKLKGHKGEFKKKFEVESGSGNMYIFSLQSDSDKVVKKIIIR
ncbi:MAG: T9SS C-terminal target domain-containing protein [Bacteroidetes bacterium]|nr:MAG: T9SS C-terminal target domain-containing protein [Bacteroidota bacterium]REK00021.1 MAG: T9SS C-terminal target domain-containing protein [Bacteroidota bacterium]REK35799.1 MAG: T9SS C-terminal target domain-containing protein [Bacteroidota bacterium]REK49329.1 MAG: T9SS C-terminal target domain-containing protein [Bacteroidota bacterium]